MKYNLCLLQAGLLILSRTHLAGAAPVNGPGNDGPPGGGPGDGGPHGGGPGDGGPHGGGPGGPGGPPGNHPGGSQTSPSVINAAANVFPHVTGGPVVIDNPPGQADPGPSVTGSLYGGVGLALLGPDGNPVNPADDSRVPNPELIPAQADPADYGFYLDFLDVDVPQPIRGSTGGTDPESVDTSHYDRYESDSFAPPGTDHGALGQLKWPLGLSHNHMGRNGSGWARQENTVNMPAATEMAGVDMRLEPNAYRELHWHSAGEWSYVLNGSCRIATVNQDGQTFIDDVNHGDLWFFPPGVPHSIQAFDKGCEFLLVFDQGAFNEDGTSLLTELFLRNPLEVLAKDLQTSIPAFDDIPREQLYIFPGPQPPSDISAQNVTGPNGPDNIPITEYSYHFSQQKPMVIPGAGWMKIADPTNFPAAADLSAALILIEPGAMRELHWHLQGDEWDFFIRGRARMTMYSPPASSETFDYMPGDVGYVPQTFAHYVENVGDEPLLFLEILKQPKFTDISVSQWLGLTPKPIVKDTLHLPDSVLDNLPKYKSYLVAGNPDLTTTNFTKPF